MKIDIAGIDFFFLTTDPDGKRKRHMVEQFGHLRLTEVHPVMGIPRAQSGATGFARMIDAGLRRQDRARPFQPFGMFEDDVVRFRDFPREIEVPDDADILYVGLSRFGMDRDLGSHFNRVYYSDTVGDVVRIYNMLSMHGAIVCSAAGAAALQRSMMEAYFKNIVWDVFTAQIQPYYNVYALKIPLVHQLAAIGGQEAFTRVTIRDIPNVPIPPDDRNAVNVSVITCRAG